MDKASVWFGVLAALFGIGIVPVSLVDGASNGVKCAALFLLFTVCSIAALAWETRRKPMAVPLKRPDHMVKFK